MSAAAQLPNSPEDSDRRIERRDDPLGTDRLARVTPAIERELERLQNELGAVQRELADLKHRDEILKYYTARLDEELKLAARVQQDFLPKHFPELGRLRFHVLYRPAGFVSGDLYDVMRLDETRLGVYMADAVGHGMPAALLTMFLKNALATKEILADGYRLLSPGQALARLNDALVAQNLSQATFATGVYALIDTQSLTLTLARGGHPAPLRLTADGALQPIEADGSLLGIFPNEPFSEITVQLIPGERVFFFTDGVEVAFSRDRAMDTECWQEQILSRRALPSAEIVSDLDARLRGTHLRDDLTMIIMDVI